MNDRTESRIASAAIDVSCARKLISLAQDVLSAHSILEQHKEEREATPDLLPVVEELLMEAKDLYLQMAEQQLCP